VPDARIPALEPFGLATVPGYRLDPETGKEAPWRADFFAWYEKVRDWRAWAQDQFARDLTFRKALTVECAKDSIFFSLLFLDVEEPRSMAYFDTATTDLDDALAAFADGTWELKLDELGYRTIHPFIPFAYQIEAHRLLDFVVLGPLRGSYHDILWDKARGIGMSYAFLAWAYARWLFVPGLRGTILTEKWDKAERSNDINSLFGKLDLFLDATPDLLLPAGFKEKGEKMAHRQRGSLVNPENGAALFTEPTTADATRSGREAYVAVDECAFHELLNKTWATIGGTAKHRIGWSSASYRYGYQWRDKLKQGQENPKSVSVRVLDWFENPHQDQGWYDAERARYRAAGQEEEFEVEYLRNAAAGSGRLVYRQQVEGAPFTDDWYDRTLPLKMSVDPGGTDYTAFVFWQTHYLDGKKRIRFLDGCQLDKVPVEFWGHVLTGIAPEPGDLCYGMWREGVFDQGNLMHIMEWMATVSPSAILLYGDPAMKRKDVTHESWISVFEKTTRELRQRRGDDPAIPIMCNMPYEILNKRNNFSDRRVGMRQALMMAEFSKTEGALAFREALEHTLFQEMTERATRPPGHIHDRHSHYVQAGEYGMVWETLNLTPGDLAVLQPKTIGPLKQTGRSAPPRSTYQRARRAHTLVGVA
jgi:hypothetical protein